MQVGRCWWWHRLSDTTSLISIPRVGREAVPAEVLQAVKPRVYQCHDICSQVTLALLQWVLPHGGSLLPRVVQECPSTSWYVATFLSVP